MPKKINSHSLDMIKKIKVEDAVGMAVAHDITCVIPGRFKGVEFKKGHVIKEEDIPKLLKLGKEYLYVLNLSDSEIHEDAAALRIAKAICGSGVTWTDTSEGKASIISKTKGLLKINVEGLLKINKIEQIIVSTLKNNFLCQNEQIVAATRIIPLATNKKKIEKIENIAKNNSPIISVISFRTLKIGAVVTGSEIYKGLIKDEFDKYVGSKIKKYGSALVKKIVTPDDSELIASVIKELKDFGVDLILITGGLSVDPDDVTLKGVKKSGARLISYGAPVMPGAMFLYAFIDTVPILGIPACIYYYPSTIFDLILPRVLAGDKVTKSDIAEMGHGGLCMNCKVCNYPVCFFGR